MATAPPKTPGEALNSRGVGYLGLALGALSAAGGEHLYSLLVNPSYLTDLYAAVRYHRDPNRAELALIVALAGIFVPSIIGAALAYVGRPWFVARKEPGDPPQGSQGLKDKP